MYVGITRAQRTLAVSWTKKRKKGREMVAAQPSRFIAEMALDKNHGTRRPAREAQGLARRIRSRPRQSRRKTASSPLSDKPMLIYFIAYSACPISVASQFC